MFAGGSAFIHCPGASDSFAVRPEPVEGPVALFQECFDKAQRERNKQS
jgi:hypothetical protein